MKAAHCLARPGMFSACRRHTTGIFDAGLQQRAPQTLRRSPVSTISAIKLSQVVQLE